MSKPTPGPWKTKRAEIPIDSEYDYAIYDEHKQVIADVFGRTSVSNRPNAEANAHLIAAAPEMREALDGVTPLCDAINELIADDEDLRARVMALFVKHGLRDDYGFLVANAIAKAKGR